MTRFAAAIAFALVAAPLVTAPAAEASPWDLPPKIGSFAGTGGFWHASIVTLQDGGFVGASFESGGGRGPVQAAATLIERGEAFNATFLMESFEPGRSASSRPDGEQPRGIGSAWIGGNSRGSALFGFTLRHDEPEPLTFLLVLWSASASEDGYRWTLHGDAQVTLADERHGTGAFLHTLGDFEHAGPAAPVPAAGHRVLVEAEKTVTVEERFFGSFHLGRNCPAFLVCAPTTGTMTWQAPDGGGRGAPDRTLAPFNALTDGPGYASGPWYRDAPAGEYAFRVDAEAVGNDAFLLGGADVDVPAFP